MKKDVDEMVCPGVEAKELRVQHMGQPCHRVPVLSARSREGPADSLGRQAFPNGRVVRDVDVVVEVEKIELIGSTVNNEGRGDEHQADGPVLETILRHPRISYHRAGRTLRLGLPCSLVSVGRDRLE